MPGAQGLWRIAKLTHDLSAFDPQGGPWESQLSVAQVRQDANKELEDKNVLVASNGNSMSDLPGMGGIFVPSKMPEEKFNEWSAGKRESACAEAAQSALNETAQKECVLMCLPEITAAMAAKESDENDKKALWYFRNFRTKYGKGRDFLILSKPHYVEDFEVFVYDTES